MTKKPGRLVAGPSLTSAFVSVLQMPSGPMQMGVGESRSVLHTYPARQSADVRHERMQPAVSRLSALSTQTLPAGHTGPPRVQRNEQYPPGAKSRLRQTPGPQSRSVVQGSPMMAPQPERQDSKARGRSMAKMVRTKRSLSAKCGPRPFKRSVPPDESAFATCLAQSRDTKSTRVATMKGNRARHRCSRKKKRREGRHVAPPRGRSPRYSAGARVRLEVRPLAPSRFGEGSLVRGEWPRRCRRPVGQSTAVEGVPSGSRAHRAF